MRTAPILFELYADRENVIHARTAVLEAGLVDVSVTYVGDWHNHPLFIEANARRVRKAIDTFPAGLRSTARVVFTAHSIPAAMAGAARYRAQLLESARLVAGRLGAPDWALVFQSRSGRPEDPWLEPDVQLPSSRAGTRPEAAVICPIGFICDHIEVLHDLDVEAAGSAAKRGCPWREPPR